MTTAGPSGEAQRQRTASFAGAANAPPLRRTSVQHAQLQHAARQQRLHAAERDANRAPAQPSARAASAHGATRSKVCALLARCGATHSIVMPRLSSCLYPSVSSATSSAMSSASVDMAREGAAVLASLLMTWHAPHPQPRSCRIAPRWQTPRRRAWTRRSAAPSWCPWRRRPRPRASRTCRSFARCAPAASRARRACPARHRGAEAAARRSSRAKAAQRCFPQ